MLRKIKKIGRKLSEQKQIKKGLGKQIEIYLTDQRRLKITMFLTDLTGQKRSSSVLHTTE